jgi:hypothetical protein
MFMMMYSFIFSTNLSETFLILRRNELDTIKMFIGLHVKYRYSCQLLINFEFSQQIFEKYSNIKFHENLSSENQYVPYGLTDMTKLISIFSEFCENA